MSQAQLSKLFSAFGLILLIITLNTWLASQGSKAILKIPLLDEERPAMAFLALVIGSVLLFLTAAVGLIHARRHGEHWHQRVPAVWLEELKTGSFESQFFQAGVILLLILVPIASFVHFGGIVLHANLCESGSSAQPRAVSEAWFSGIAQASDQIRLVDELTQVTEKNGSVIAQCKGGIQVFPGWEFIALAIALAAATVMSGLFLVSLFLPHAQLKNDPAERLE